MNNQAFELKKQFKYVSNTIFKYFTSDSVDNINLKQQISKTTLLNSLECFAH